MSQYEDESDMVSDSDMEQGLGLHACNDVYDYLDEPSDTGSMDGGYKKKHTHEVIGSAKGKYKIFRTHPTKHTRVPIEVFTTRTTPGARIRNAETGMYETSAYVGKLDEELFFKVIMATGELGDDSNHLFYDSPEQYERHCLTEVDAHVKEQWQERMQYRSNIIRDKSDKHVRSVIIR